MSNRSTAVLWLFWAVINFILFAYDIQNDRDFWTWLWLLNAQISFMGSLRYYIKHDNEKQ